MSQLIPKEAWKEDVQAVIRDVQDERLRQFEKWGYQAHDLPTYLTILAEEVGELSEEILKDKFDQRTDSLYVEATHVAAVALAIMQRIKIGAS